MNRFAHDLVEKRAKWRKVQRENLLTHLKEYAGLIQRHLAGENVASEMLDLVGRSVFPRVGSKTFVPRCGDIKGRFSFCHEQGIQPTLDDDGLPTRFANDEDEVLYRFSRWGQFADWEAGE